MADRTPFPSGGDLAEQETIAATASPSPSVSRRRVADAETDVDLRFLLRVVQGLPLAWRVDRRSSDRNEQLLSLKTDGGLDVNHAALRQRLADRYTRDPHWDQFPFTIEKAVLAALESGEMEIQEAKRAMNRCSRAFGQEHLMTFWSRAERITPKPWSGGRRPRPPAWIKRVAVTIARVLKAENPDLCVSAEANYSEHAHRRATMHRATLKWLDTLGVDARTVKGQKPTPGTLDDWRREVDKKDGPPTTLSRRKNTS